MSLATRCTACGTVFRVVQDQLKVSEGWVRCGRCNDVFNALDGLFDLERDPPPDRGAPKVGEPVVIAAGRARGHDVDIDIDVEEPVSHPDLELPMGEETGLPAMMSPHDSGQQSTPAGRVSERDRLEFPDAQFDSDMPADDIIQLRSPAVELESTSVAARNSQAAAFAEAPEFVRHAQRRERWRSPAMRMLQGSALLLLVAALGLQIVHHYRNAIAARWPVTDAVLTTWCGLVGCTLEAPSRIEDIAVESTALTRASGPDAFNLAVMLHNRGGLSVAFPSVDLTLTDANGQLIARRMLSPHEFRAASAMIKPGADSALQVTLVAGGARVTGYTVEVFYP